jgi:hypothetical protein
LKHFYPSNTALIEEIHFMVRSFSATGMMPFLLVTALLAGVCVTGCSTRRVMVDGFVDMVETGMPAFEREDDLALLADALPAHIKLLETVLVNDPDNPRLLLLSRAYGAYAFAVLETTWERRKYSMASESRNENDLQALEQRIKRYFGKGMDTAVRVLEIRRPGARNKLNRPREAGALFASMDRSDVPALFWYGFNLGFYVQHNLDAIGVVAKAYLVEKAMRRVIELDPGYYHGSAHVILMAYYASRPPMMGGNPQAAAAQYRIHKEGWPHTPGLRERFWARYYWVYRQDRTAFRRVLNRLIATPLDDAHPLKLLEHVARVRAAIYLKAEQQLFEGS